MTAVKKPLVMTPALPVLSNLDLYGDDFNRSGGRSLLSLRWLTHHLETSDFFPARAPRSGASGSACSRRRSHQPGQLQDPELHRLLAVVPFGVPDAPPEPGAPVAASAGHRPRRSCRDLGGRHVELGRPAHVDPCHGALLRAPPGREDADPRHAAPQSEIGEMAIARGRALATELGLLERSVSFIDWVPYAERHRYLLERHRREPAPQRRRVGFAFRTRVLDYVWCGVPMVVTAGDELAA